MRPTTLGFLPFILCTGLGVGFASAQELTPAALEQRAARWVLENAGPERRWHAVDGAESPLTAFLVRGPASVKLAALTRWAAGALDGFDPQRELLLAVRTGEYVENTLHVSRVDREGQITYVGGILFVDLPYTIDDAQRAAFEAEALKAYGVTFQQLEDGDVDEDELMDRILAGARELALEPPPSGLVIQPRPGARSAYLFDSPVLRGRQVRLPGGTPVRIVQSEVDKGRRWLYVKTEVDVRGKPREGWIPASRVARAEPGLTGGLTPR